MSSEFDSRRFGPPAKIVTGTFDGPMAGQQPYASVEDANGNELATFNGLFDVLRARLWLLAHGHNPFLGRS